jgi:hypothetical protein
MDTAKWDRRALLTGLLAPIFWVIGVMMSESGDTRPDFNARPEEIATYLEGNSTKVLLGAVLFSFGGLLFMWFLGAFRALAFVAEGGAGRLTGTLFGTGLAFIIFIMSTWAPQVGAGIFIEDGDATLSPEAAQALWLAGDGFFVLAEYALAGFLLASALLIFRGFGLPKWLGWVALPMALVLLIAPIGWAVMVFVFPFWLIAASLFLWRRTAVPASTVGTA